MPAHTIVADKEHPSLLVRGMSGLLHGVAWCRLCQGASLVYLSQIWRYKCILFSSSEWFTQSVSKSRHVNTGLPQRAGLCAQPAAAAHKCHAGGPGAHGICRERAEGAQDCERAHIHRAGSACRVNWACNTTFQSHSDFKDGQRYNQTRRHSGACSIQLPQCTSGWRHLWLRRCTYLVSTSSASGTIMCRA